MTHQEARARRHLIRIGGLVQAWGYLDESRGHYILEPRGFRLLEPWRVPGREPRVVSRVCVCAFCGFGIGVGGRLSNSKTGH